MTAKAKTPLGDKNLNVVYIVPCRCHKHSYSGETYRKWETGHKEYQDKVRLTKQDIDTGNIELATTRLNTNDGGLAKYMSTCGKIVCREGGGPN